MSVGVDVTSDNFKNEVLESKIPVLVDFWAPWCGPCKAISPVIESLAKEYEGKLRLVKVNVDNDGSIASEYSVRGIPTLIIFSGGEVSGSMVGAATKEKIEDFIKQHID
ncbi:MAG: thioredoxin [Legionellales bacterium]|jgi:thioredoxin 1|nr:thioredoxin [Legionellales bacterium]